MFGIKGRKDSATEEGRREERAKPNPYPAEMKTAVFGIVCVIALFVLYRRSNHVKLRKERVKLLET